uniref:Uncharacterized protein n=1 Tax=Arundo donax TaxID=35708 RepID=A0A0A9GT39_ARUDO
MRSHCCGAPGFSSRGVILHDFFGWFVHFMKAKLKPGTSEYFPELKRAKGNAINKLDLLGLVSSHQGSSFSSKEKYA